MSAAVLEVRSLSWGWPGAIRPLLEIASLRLDAGDFLFLQGASGSGKSTLLSLLAGVRTAGSGAVQLLGEDWSAMPAGRRDQRRADHVGLVFQQFNLLAYLPVIDNVLLPCRFSPRRAQRAADVAGSAFAAAQRLLAAMGLDATTWMQPTAQLSVGQQQRVAAARALIGAPELILADEPTSALDEARRDEFMNLLLHECASAGSALVFVSHDIRLASRFGRHVVLGALSGA